LLSIYEALFRRANLWAGADDLKPAEVMERLRVLDDLSERDVQAILAWATFLKAPYSSTNGCISNLGSGGLDRPTRQRQMIANHMHRYP